jgi:ABC-type amino acid transport system permease subunit
MIGWKPQGYTSAMILGAIGTALVVVLVIILLAIIGLFTVLKKVL